MNWTWQHWACVLTYSSAVSRSRVRGRLHLPLTKTVSVATHVTFTSSNAQYQWCHLVLLVFVKLSYTWSLLPFTQHYLLSLRLCDAHKDHGLGIKWT